MDAFGDRKGSLTQAGTKTNAPSASLVFRIDTSFTPFSDRGSRKNQHYTNLFFLKTNDL